MNLNRENSMENDRNFSNNCGDSENDCRNSSGAPDVFQSTDVSSQRSQLIYDISAESELTRYLLYEDDILLSLTGNVGRVGLLPKEMLPAALNQRVACLRIKDDTLMVKFLYQFLNSDYFEQKCIESARGIAQLNMSTEWLKDYPLPILSLSEQESIVAELDGINRLIDLQEEQLREYDRLAQSLFYTTFGDPATNPKGWEVKKLGEVAETTSGGTPSKGHNEYWCSLFTQRA